jgi:hypothetical protein
MLPEVMEQTEQLPGQPESKLGSCAAGHGRSTFEVDMESLFIAIQLPHMGNQALRFHRL